MCQQCCQQCIACKVDVFENSNEIRATGLHTVAGTYVRYNLQAKEALEALHVYIDE